MSSISKSWIDRIFHRLSNLDEAGCSSVGMEIALSRVPTARCAVPGNSMESMILDMATWRVPLV